MLRRRELDDNECIDLERLMLTSTDSGMSALSEVSALTLGPGPVSYPQICYNLLLPPSLDLGCFQPNTHLESLAKRALMSGMATGNLPNTLRPIQGEPAFGIDQSRRELHCLELITLATLEAGHGQDKVCGTGMIVTISMKNGPDVPSNSHA